MTRFRPTVCRSVRQSVSSCADCLSTNQITEFYAYLYRYTISEIIRWRSISVRAGPAFLQFDWSKAGLSMDLPVFVYSHTKTSFRFLSIQRKYREAFHVVTDLLLQATQREPYWALVLSRLRLSRSTDHQDRNLHSLSHRFQSSCS